jgi:hypothetical protein
MKMSDADHTDSTDPCPACGARLGGRAGCQDAFDQLSALSYTSAVRGGMHNMLVDVYAVQHPEEYGVSAKSYIRHLYALGVLLEFPSDFRLYWATPQSGKPVPAPPKPPLLTSRGSLTIAHALNAADDAAYRKAVEEWAADVWRAYAPQHELYRNYLAAVKAAGPLVLPAMRVGAPTAST